MVKGKAETRPLTGYIVLRDSALEDLCQPIPRIVGSPVSMTYGFLAGLQTRYGT